MEANKSARLYKILLIVSWVFFILTASGIYFFSGKSKVNQNLSASSLTDTFASEHRPLIDSIRDLQDIITGQFAAIDSSLWDKTVPVDQKNKLLKLSGSLISCKYLLDDEIDSVRLAAINGLTIQINSTLKDADKNIGNLKKIAERTATISKYLDGISQALAILLSHGIIKPKALA